MGTDLIEVVEAAYRIDLDDATWIAEVTRAAGPLLDAGLGVAGYLIDTTGRGPATHTPVFVGQRDPWDGEWRRAWWDARVSRMPVRLIAELAGFGSPAFASESCGAVIQGTCVARLARAVPPMKLPPGVREAFVVSGYDPGGEGAVLFAFRSARTTDAPRERARWERLSGHLAAAVRLRRTHGATRTAPRSLAASVDRARTRRGRSRDDALGAWPVLHRGCSIVPTERGYVTVDNPPVPSTIATLTDREAAAVALLCLGRSNKAIAYELGIALSTASSLLASAASRLGVRTTRALISATRHTVHAAPRARDLARSAELTEAETVVLTLLLAGLSDAEIGAVRKATRSTVTKQVDAVYRKLGVGSRRELLSANAPWSAPENSATTVP